MRRLATEDDWRWGTGFWISFLFVLMATAAAFFVKYQEVVPALAQTEEKFRATQSYAPMPAPRRAFPAVDRATVASITAPAATTTFPAEPTDQKQTAACDIDQCSRAYRSFRQADCTYQPYNGGRKLCLR